MTSVKWGIIGCGDVCEVKSGPALRLCPDSSVVHVMRRDAAKAADYARRHGIPRWSSDAAAVIADPEVNAVYVATPVGSHLDYALAVAAAGKPCLVEKPMARSHAECQVMIDAFAQAGVPLYVAFYRRCLPWFVHAKALIDAGRIGDVTSVGLTFLSPGQRVNVHADRWRLDATLAGGGLFMDLASHTLDVIDFLLGPIAETAGVATNRAGMTEVEDTISLHFRLASGPLGTGRWDFAAASNVDAIRIDGTLGHMTLSTFGKRVETHIAGAEPEVFDPPAPPHVHSGLVATVVGELLGRDTCPSTGVSAARTAAVMDTALASYYGGRDDAFWERPLTWPGRPETPGMLA